MSASQPSSHTDPAPAELKKQLRQWARRFRDRLDTQAISRSICEQLALLPQIQAAKTLLAYSALPGEIDISGLQAILNDRPEQREAVYWYLPKTISSEMRFHRHKPGSPVVKSAFGILEPPVDSPELQEDEAVDIILLPGLMFDRHGNRLGYGKGYYDRFLQTRLQNIPDQGLLSPLLIGITPELLYVPALPSEPWDHPVQWVATEVGIHRTKTSIPDDESLSSH